MGGYKDPNYDPVATSKYNALYYKTHRGRYTNQNRSSFNDLSQLSKGGNAARRSKPVNSLMPNTYPTALGAPTTNPLMQAAAEKRDNELAKAKEQANKEIDAVEKKVTSGKATAADAKTLVDTQENYHKEKTRISNEYNSAVSGGGGGSGGSSATSSKSSSTVDNDELKNWAQSELDSKKNALKEELAKSKAEEEAKEAEKAAKAAEKESKKQAKASKTSGGSSRSSRGSSGGSTKGGKSSTKSTDNKSGSKGDLVYDPASEKVASKKTGAAKTTSSDDATNAKSVSLNGLNAHGKKIANGIRERLEKQKKREIEREKEKYSKKLEELSVAGLNSAADRDALGVERNNLKKKYLDAVEAIEGKYLAKYKQEVKNLIARYGKGNNVKSKETKKQESDTKKADVVIDNGPTRRRKSK